MKPLFRITVAVLAGRCPGIWNGRLHDVCPGRLAQQTPLCVPKLLTGPILPGYARLDLLWQLT